METLLAPTTNEESLRILKALKILELVADGKTQRAACKEVGMRPDDYRAIRDREAEGLASFQLLIIEETRARLAVVLSAQRRVLEKTIKNGLKDNAKLNDQIKLVQMLESLGDKLTDEARVGDTTDESAREILSGPVLRSATSKLTVTVEVESPQVLDLQPLSHSESASPSTVVEVRSKDAEPGSDFGT